MSPKDAMVEEVAAMLDIYAAHAVTRPASEYEAIRKDHANRIIDVVVDAITSAMEELAS